MLQFYMGVEQNQGADPELEAFIGELRGDKEEILGRVQALLHKPNKTRDEVALGIYLDTILKSEVYGVNPFVSPGDQEAQEGRNLMAFMATEHVAKEWFGDHPDSEAAREIVERSIFASSEAHRTLLREMWSSIRSKL